MTARHLVMIHGRRIEAAELAGDPRRRPLVLMHEGLGSVGLWRGFPARLAEATGRRLLMFSRFGHGRSEPPPSPRTPAFFHEEALVVLPEVLRQLDASNPVLVGHSDGGSIALIHAAHHPVTGIALLAPHAFVEEVTVEAIAATRRTYLEDGLRDRLARHHDDPDAAFWGWCDVWLDPQFRSWELNAEAASVTAPMLLIQGDRDPYGTLEQIERIGTAARGPTTRLVVAGGHSPHFEQPDAVIAAITAFVETLA